MTCKAIEEALFGIALVHKFCKSLVNGVEEGLGINRLLVRELAHSCKVLVHNAVLHSLYGSLFQLVGIAAESGDIIHFASLAERTRPCKDSCNGVCGGLFAFQL